MQWVCYNGHFLPHEQPLFTASNRGFRYGDGLFETAKFYNGRFLLAPYHFDRLFSGLKLLNINPQFTSERLSATITGLCERNHCAALARVRIAACREADSASYLIEATALDAAKMQWNDQGWRLVLYPFARKSCDAFANLKSANYLPYVMAGRYATEKGADECLVLNGHNRICDGSKTNLFFIRNNEAYTPALSEGPVAGVMRRAVMEFLKSSGYAVHQKGITMEDVLQADAVFVTNAIEGLRWVQRVGEREYNYGVLKKLYHDLFATLYTS
jgi:branched-chain amino acid aminotransferase